MATFSAVTPKRFTLEDNYWIFNLVASCLEAYTQPYQDLQGNFGYANKQIFLPTASVTLPGFPDLSLDLSRVFPSYEA